MSPRRLGRFAFAAFMVAAGVNHFVDPDFYLSLMPPWLPWHEPLVFWSGVAEVAAGLGVLIPPIRRWAGWFAIAVLLAVFPANVWMAVDSSVWPDVPTWARWARLPFQAFFIWWAWIVTKPDAPETIGRPATG